MPLLRITNLSIAFGSHALLDAAELQIKLGERLGLIGRNGEGKSTLMHLIAGKIQPDNGDIWLKSGLKLAMLEQVPDLAGFDTIYDAVADGLGTQGQWIAEYHALSMNSDLDQQGLKQLSRLQDLLESNDGWSLQQRVETVLSRLDLPPDNLISGLSGGWQRRVALARALVVEPQLLLLDEPTNHLDLEAILWLEEHLLEFPGAVLMVTHDRSFLQRLATRIIDLDRGRLVSWPGDYPNYLKLKAAALEEEMRRDAEFDKKLAKEEVWVRQGIKARRTRNEGRVRALQKLRAERSQRRNVVGQAKLQLDRGERSGKRVIEVEDVNFSYDQTPILSNFSTTILRGDRVGLIGPNGAGKTTLLKLLLKKLEPDSGAVKLGTRIEVAYFDQMRDDLDPDQTVADWVADGSDFVDVKDRRLHILSYLNDFLFSPDRARSPIKSLSGGEQNRIMLARLFIRPANLLVMDEPTNDLDIETLELLETLLLNYDGSLLLVSHDREFLDNVVTSTLVFEGDGLVKEYVGGYTDWIQQRQSSAESIPPAKPEKLRIEKKVPVRSKAKLSYKEKRELEDLPAKIEKMELKQAEVNQLIAGSDFYQSDKEIITKTLDELKSLGDQLEQTYARWDELEALESEILQNTR